MRHGALIISLLGLATMVAEVTNAKFTCGPVTKSRLRPLLRCFDGIGPCVRDSSLLPIDGSITDCWSNGTRVQMDGFNEAGIGLGHWRLVNCKGKVCLRGIATIFPDMSLEIRYRRWETGGP